MTNFKSSAEPHLSVTPITGTHLAFVAIVNNPLTPSQMRDLAAEMNRQADALDRSHR